MTKHIELNYEKEKLRYPKMQTLYKRDMDIKGCPIIEGDYSKEEFLMLKKWIVTEKIDGTNVRIFWDDDGVQIRGRNDHSNMPASLHKCLEIYFSVNLMEDQFEESDVVLFGEGFGPGIQKGGGLYTEHPSFILFDVKIGDWWLEYDKVEEIAYQLGIPVVPLLGIWNLDEIVEFVKSKPISEYASSKEKLMEGIVATSDPLVLFRNSNPLKFKLKVKDFD